MLKRILDGYEKFSQNLSEEDKALFSELGQGQNPKALLITCSDSRLVPQLFTQTGPGDLFMVRNPGNIVPEAGKEGVSGGDQAEMASVEYAVKFLQTKHIIVCGHSDCGAMKAMLHGGVSEEETPHLHHWLKHAEDTTENFEIEKSKVWDHLSQLSQFNVVKQLEHLKSYRFIQNAMENNQLTLHGWYFHIPSATLYTLDDEKKKFFSVLDGDDEEE